MNNIRDIANKTQIKKNIYRNIDVILIIFIATILTSINSKDIQISTIFAASFIVSIILINWAIPRLNNLKLKQIIREEGPKSHYKKSNTPTMGGILIIPIGLFIGVIGSKGYFFNDKLVGILIVSLLYMLIGFIDDWKSHQSKVKKGMSGETKISLQLVSGIIFLLWCNMKNLISPEITLIGEKIIDLGLLIWPLTLFVVVAQSNATNLTDGLDGLASSCSSLVFTGLSLHLLFEQKSNYMVMAIIAISMAGSLLGFLIHNRYPARIFMGDTGSLPIGAIMAGIAIMSDNLVSLFIMSGVFFLESISVIIQVLVFKLTKKLKGTGKKIFLMTPLHHHFELSGFSENQIVKGCYLTTLCLVMVSLLIN